MRKTTATDERFSSCSIAPAHLPRAFDEKYTVDKCGANIYNVAKTDAMKGKSTVGDEPTESSRQMRGAGNRSGNTSRSIAPNNRRPQHAVAEATASRLRRLAAVIRQEYSRRPSRRAAPPGWPQFRDTRKGHGCEPAAKKGGNTSAPSSFSQG